MRRSDSHTRVGHLLVALGLVATLAGGGLAAAREVPFGGKQLLFAAPSPTSNLRVFAADLDGDGDLDALAGVSTGDTIAWHENLGPDDGMGSNSCGVATTACFGAQQVISTAADDPQSVLAIDIDGDGDLDALSASSFDDKIAWYENLGPDDGMGSNSCGAATTACFGTQQVISTAADLLESIFAADVDGDGDTDVLSASSTDDKIAWYENLGPDDGMGSNSCGVATTACFGGQQVISTAASRARSVVAADVDGDGDVDALTATFADSTIAWYENLGPDDGMGSNTCGVATTACFGAQQVITTAAALALSVFAADVDNDGDVDALSASLNDDKIAWYENLGPDDGMGSNSCGVATTACFGAQQVISTVADGPRSVFAADVDGDGDIDAFSASGDKKIAWYENLGPDDGMGSNSCGLATTACFGAQQVITTEGTANPAVVADVDGDGDVDLLATLTAELGWYENRTIHRNADFPTPTTISAATTGANKVACGDLDGDGDPDVLSADRTGGRISLHKNGGDGTSWTGVQVLGMLSSPRSVATADLDRDGDLDALSATAGDNTIRWHENTAGDSSAWSATAITSSATGANDVAAADVDGDGDLDAVSASTDDDRIAWYENRLNEPSADFGPQQTISTAADGARSVVAADIDGDGDPDVVSASQEDDKIAWYENVDGSFQPQQLVISLTVESAQSVFATDMDRDGDVDVLSAGQGQVAWHENSGSGLFPQTHVIATLTNSANEVWAADLDRDGDLDVLAALPDDNRVVWFENAGATWVPHVVSSTATGARHAIAVDVDRDGALDIVSAASTADKVVWHRNAGGQFSTAATDFAQKVVANGQMEDVLAIEVTHEGRAGDTDVELVELEARLTDSGGTPLASVQAKALIDMMRVFRDDGSGVFEEATDNLVATLASTGFDLGLDGRQALSIPDDDPNARVSFGTPTTFFVTFEMTADAESQLVAAFQVEHQSTADAADDADNDIPLALDEGAMVATGVIDTALSTATCTAPFDLNLENRTITTTVVCEAGTVLRTGADVVVATPGDLTLKAATGVEMGDGLEVGDGAALQVE